MRNNYWTCSKFADWLRGTTKLNAGTSEEWNEWESRAKSAYPVRWWLAEEGLDHLQKFIMWPTDKLYAIKYYVNNRWITRTHALTAHPSNIKPGDWCDVGNRFLPCMFNELVDFVEVELAWWHLAWSPEERPKYNMPWWAVGWWRIRTWRCPQAGLDNLAWQMSITAKEDYGLNPGDKGYGEPTRQAKNAAEVLALYKWWTEVYPNRPDPHDASGWSRYCDLRREEEGEGHRWIGVASKNPATEKLGKQALKLSSKIEEQYDKEDEAMMIRLIKIRNSLWT
jgi:hypothetical protein